MKKTILTLTMILLFSANIVSANADDMADDNKLTQCPANVTASGFVSISTTKKSPDGSMDYIKKHKNILSQSAKEVGITDFVFTSDKINIYTMESESDNTLPIKENFDVRTDVSFDFKPYTAIEAFLKNLTDKGIIADLSVDTDYECDY